MWLFTLTMCFCVIVVPVSALLFHYYFVIGHYHLLCIMLITPSLFSLLSCAVCCQIVVLCSFMSQLHPQLMFCLHRDRASFVLSFSFVFSLFLLLSGSANSPTLPLLTITDRRQCSSSPRCRCATSSPPQQRPRLSVSLSRPCCGFS